jgi:hypothetical protein
MGLFRRPQSGDLRPPAPRPNDDFPIQKTQSAAADSRIAQKRVALENDHLQAWRPGSSLSKQNSGSHARDPGNKSPVLAERNSALPEKDSPASKAAFAWRSKQLEDDDRKSDDEADFGEENQKPIITYVSVN